MKQANHNEVDLLLRSLARGREAASQNSFDRGDGEGSSSAHLDADELNSYAEGVAPPPARARYTEHLADCAACRGIVVGLSQAAGVANRLEVPEQKGGASFWQKFGALLSPPMLRIAVSAVVLIAVVGIAFLALRQGSGLRMVAQNEPISKALPAAQNDTAPPVNPTPESETKTGDGAFPVTASGSPDKRQVTLDNKAGVVEEVPPSPIAKAAPKDAGSSIDGADASVSQPFAREPKAAAPPPPILDTEKSAELAKERSAKREDRARDQDEVFRNEADDIHGPNRARNMPAPVATQRSGVAGGRGGPSSADKKKMAEAETRTVMGRHFTREGDGWVDVAYDSSRATVRLSRGSDQFRALVADEPGIRTIAEQLNGVVIVVWKGRAYRIQ
jgi:hypothetical protein